MSARRCILILFAVAVLPFIGISESSSVEDDPKIGPDMNPLENDHSLIVIPVRSNGTLASDRRSTLTYESTGKTVSEDHKDTADDHSTKENLRNQYSDTSSDIRARTGRMRRGAKKAHSGKALYDKEVPSFVGNSKTSCLLPENGLTTAEIRCKLTPTFKTCKSYCIFGYTYEEGIVRTSQCNYLENRWSQQFDECKPFVDCYLKMVAPGSLKCLANEVENPPKCEIECKMYNENDPIPRQNFTCNVDGSWDPYLPHCVEPRGNKIMANPPADLEHGDILYP